MLREFLFSELKAFEEYIDWLTKVLANRECVTSLVSNIGRLAELRRNTRAKQIRCE